uniref:ATP synthase F0 subunit 8 n=1 Tax=Centruroides vittatus TaxID=120091 RepID=A0A343UQG7_CENVT|nr:ATP synthase F0 subunit 8 [Centruroides vittatus]AVF96942.1 ATP synthase F0 subunit 8 [Centruroides vittatus]
MPQMSPLGWAWISIFVGLIYLFYLVLFYFFYIVSFKVMERGEAFGLVWFWEW